MRFQFTQNVRCDVQRPAADERPTSIAEIWAKIFSMPPESGSNSSSRAVEAFNEAVLNRASLGYQVEWGRVAYASFQN
jgi:hypothetical protein